MIGPGGWAFGILLVVWALAVVIPNIAVTIRRLHDAGYSGWFYLFNVVGLGIVTLVLCAMETSPGRGQVRSALPAGVRHHPAATGSRTRATVRLPASRSSTDLLTSRAAVDLASTAALSFRVVVVGVSGDQRGQTPELPRR